MDRESKRGSSGLQAICDGIKEHPIKSRYTLLAGRGGLLSGPYFPSRIHSSPPQNFPTGFPPPFHLDVRRARGLRIELHPVVSILLAKGCRMRRCEEERGQ
jgi:hypothetical protein